MPSIFGGNGPPGSTFKMGTNTPETPNPFSAIGQKGKPNNTGVATLKSPTIHSSQIAGGSATEVPKIFNFGNIPTNNRFQGLQDENNTGAGQNIPEENPTPINKKRPMGTPTSPIKNNNDKKQKINTKTIKIIKRDSYSNTEEWKTRSISTQTETIVKIKTIIPTKFQTQQEQATDTQVDSEMGIGTAHAGVDMDNVEDILKHLGKNIASDKIFILVKLLSALINKLTTEEYSTEYLLHALCSK